MLTAAVVPLASTAYDIGLAVGYVIVPVIIGAIILVIARRQDRSKGPAAGTATMQANPFAPASASAPAQTSPAQAATPPGWYDDPWRQARLRGWDGVAWTGHTAP